MDEHALCLSRLVATHAFCHHWLYSLYKIEILVGLSVPIYLFQAGASGMEHYFYGSWQFVLENKRFNCSKRSSRNIIRFIFILVGFCSLVAQCRITD